MARLFLSSRYIYNGRNMAGRYPVLRKTFVFQTRIELDQYSKLKDIAALESATSGKYVSVQDLVRNALTFVYDDGERLRECFRRSRLGKLREQRNKNLKKIK